MNILIAALLCFALLGALDKLFNGVMGVAPAFDQGLASMGPLCLSMAGIYCAATALLGGGTPGEALAQLPFDPSLLAGALLAPDMGGYTLAVQLARDSQLGAYSAVLVTSTLGTLVSFALPISLGSLPAHEVQGFMQGVLWGIISLPLGLLAGGLVLGMGPAQLWGGLWPVCIICLGLCAGLRFAPRGCLRAISILGQLVRAAGILLLCVVTAGVFVPRWAVVDPALVTEVLLVVFRITAVVCGSLVAANLLMHRAGRLLQRAGRALRVNEYAVVGLLASLANSISMLPLYSRMDVRGKVMNAAFTVSGAFCLGGQLAFVAAVATGQQVTAFLVAKLAAGLAAVWLALKFTRGEQPEPSEQPEDLPAA